MSRLEYVQNDARNTAIRYTSGRVDTVLPLCWRERNKGNISAISLDTTI